MRSIRTEAVRLLTAWRRAGQGRSIDNARRAAVHCSRRRLEREEVALFLADHVGVPPATATK